MKTALTLAITGLLLITSIQAQITTAKPEEWSAIKKKTLLVELLEEDAKQLESWQKKVSKTKSAETKKEFNEKIAEHKQFVNDYNEMIKAAVELTWNFNQGKEIVYKTSSQVDKLMESSTRYVVLF